MHALYDGIRRHHDIVARRFQDRGIVGQIERAGVGGERLEETRDQGVFSGGHVGLASRCRRPLCPHPEERPLGRVSKDAQRTRCPRRSFETPRKRAAPQDEGEARENSSPRNWRAIWSSTALIMPVSSRSTKAWATSTYSDTTTRAGTSLRCSSS